jgi:tRNA(fMet)-specific endonuclease VapC
MNQFLLDTNVCIEILRGNPNIRQQLINVGVNSCSISEITVIELKVGQELAKSKSARGQYKNQFVDEFIQAINVVPISCAINYFAKEKVRLQLAGTPANNNFDLLIGCTSVVCGLTLITDNIKDFKRIKGIDIVNWMER